MFHWRERKCKRLPLKPSCWRRERKVITHLKQKRSDFQGFETATRCRSYSETKHGLHFHSFHFEGWIITFMIHSVGFFFYHCRIDARKAHREIMFYCFNVSIPAERLIFLLDFCSWKSKILLSIPFVFVLFPYSLSSFAFITFFLHVFPFYQLFVTR